MDVVVRASTSQTVDLGFIPLVESYQKSKKNSIHSFPAWRSAFRGVVENRPAGSLDVFLGKHSTERPHVYVEDRWPRHLENGNSQASENISSKRPRYNSLSRKWRINMSQKIFAIGGSTKFLFQATSKQKVLTLLVC